MTMKELIAFLCVLACISHSEAAGVQCISNNGDPVDWFIAYKLPVNVGSLPKNFFFYMDATNVSWQQSPKTMDQPKHAIYFTLNQIYSSSYCKNATCTDSNLLFMMYNNMKPNSAKLGSDYKGHTKGVVAFGKTSGFWLVHSTPQFPPPKASGYNWPDSGKRNGQTFLCISMATDSNLDTVGRQLLYYYPDIYDKASSSYFDQKFPNMAAALSGNHVTGPPWNREAELTSLGGTIFRSFAKFSKFGKDLYADWLAPRFEDTLLVQTWQSGPGGKLCSNCTITYKVFNVESVAFKQASVIFKATKDHSKWAITAKQPWTCIGDINRMKSQEHRAGGAVCMDMPNVWINFNAIVNSTHDCGPCA